MGMSSSQARLLSLTARSHDIELRAQKLQADKLRMANDSDQVYNKYMNALSATKIQAKVWDKWEGDTFKDATLAMLENGIVPDDTGEHANKILFLQTQDGKILVTPTVANHYGLTSTGNETRDIDTFIEETTGKTKSKIPIQGEVPDYDKIIEFTPIDNIIEKNPSSSTSYTPVQNPARSNTKTYIDSLYTDSNTSNDIPITISSEDELIEFLNNSDCNNKNILLTQDINMTGKTFTSKATFSGNFNGGGHSIIGLNNSLFDTLDGATVSNLSLKNVNISSNDQFEGALALMTKNGTKVENIIVNGNVESTYTGTGSSVAGLIGKSSETCTFEKINCAVNVTSKGVNGYLAGVIGGAGSNTVISDITYDGNINYSGSGSNSGLHVGGIVGCIGGTTVKNCSSTGIITAPKATNIGGIAGINWDAISTIENCSSSVTFTSQNGNVGGILGAAGNTTISNCYDKTSGANYAILGGSWTGNSGNYNVKIENCNSQSYSDSNKWYSISNNAQGGYNGTLSVDAVNNSSTNITPPTVPSMTTVTPSGVTYTEYLTGNVLTSASITSIQSNIKCVFENAGITSITDDQILNWLNNNFGTDNNENNKKLASLNDNLCDYLNGTTTSDSIATSLKNAINTGNTTTCGSYLNKYASETIANRSNATTICQTNISSSNGAITIPSINNIATSIYCLLASNGKTDVSEADVTSWINTQYSTSSEDDKVYLANLNEDIKNGTSVNTLYNMIKTGNKYTNTNTYQLGKWDVSFAGNQTVNIKYGTKTEIIDFKYAWDTTDPDITNAIAMYTLSKRGVTIITNEQAASYMYLKNMLETGEAVLTTFNPSQVGIFANLSQDQINNMSDAEYNKFMGIKNTSISVETSIQQVSDTEYVKHAEAEYEAAMRKINRKETKIDTELSQLETERTSIKAEQDGLTKVINDNIDLSFKLFS